MIDIEYIENADKRLYKLMDNEFIAKGKKITSKRKNNDYYGIA